MNSSTVSSDSLTCQEDLFTAAAAIEILGILSVTSLVGVLGLLLWPAYLAKKKDDSKARNSYFLAKYAAGTLGVLGIAAGVVGIVGNLILGPITLAECGTADYTFYPSILFSATLVILIIGAVPSVILWFIEKERKAFSAVLVTFAIIAGVAYFGGGVASLFHWSKYT